MKMIHELLRATGVGRFIAGAILSIFMVPALVSCASTGKAVMYDGPERPLSEVSVLLSESFEKAPQSTCEYLLILSVDGKLNDLKKRTVHVLPGEKNIRVTFYVCAVGLVQEIIANRDAAQRERTIQLTAVAGRTYVLRFLPSPVKYWIEDVENGEVVVGERPRWVSRYEVE